MDKQAIQQQALSNAVNGQSLANYAAIISGFADKGITDVQPRVNIFTYNAWKALGRQVRKGEHGVKVCTYVPMSKSEQAADGTTTERSFRAPRMTTVFHVSQTDAVAGGVHPVVQKAHDEFFQTQDKAQAQYVRENTERATEYYSEQFTPIA